MGMPIDLIEFPADDLARARQFWEGLLGLALDGRSASEGQGVQSHGDGPALGLHERGRGPGDRFSLPYFGCRTCPLLSSVLLSLAGTSCTRGSAGQSVGIPRGA